MALAARQALLALCVILAVHAQAATAAWRNTEGGSFTFQATFEGEPLDGSFGNFNVAFRFDPEAPEDAKLVVTVDLAAADLGDPEMNAILSDEAWFNIRQFTSAVFECTEVRGRGEGEFVAVGRLQLKGVEKPVSVPFSWSLDGDQARMRGEFSLQRTDFDVGSGEWSTGDSVGLQVHLAFDIPLTHAE